MFNFSISKFRSISLPTEQEIMKKWNINYSKPVVSVICLTYNQDPYIEDTIRGFLIQKTNFPFEIIIHDDASVDKTADIILNYVERYPNIIKPILQKENQYSKSPNFVLSIPFEAASGEYLAYCEGDDYWIDSSKLQKQFDILSNNNKYGLVFTDFNILYQKNSIMRINRFKEESYKFPLLMDLESFIVRRSFMAPCTWFMRREFFYKPSHETLDATFCWLVDVLSKTKIYFLRDTTTVYRVLEESASHSKSYEKMYIREKNIYDMQIYFFNEFSLNKDLLNEIKVNYFNKIIHLLISLSKSKELMECKNVFRFLSPRAKAIFLISFLPFSKCIISFLYEHKNIFK